MRAIGLWMVALGCGCTIDVEAADRCLAFLQDAPCADWDDKQIEEECQDVYTEC